MSTDAIPALVVTPIILQFTEISTIFVHFRQICNVYNRRTHGPAPYDDILTLCMNRFFSISVDIATFSDKYVTF